MRIIQQSHSGSSKVRPQAVVKWSLSNCFDQSPQKEASHVYPSSAETKVS